MPSCLTHAARLVFGVVFLAAVLGRPSVANDDILTIGKVSSNPSKHFARMSAFGAYVAGKLQDKGISRHRVVFAPDLETLAEQMASGDVDITSETVYSAIELESRGAANILLREWKAGVPEYHSVIVVPARSTIQTIDDLKGKTVLFEDPYSTSGHLMARYELMSKGLEFALAGGTRAVGPDAVLYRFTFEEINSLTSLARGEGDAAVFSDTDWVNDEVTPVVFKSRMRIIHETSPLMRSALLVSQTMPSSLRNAVSDALIAMVDDEEARMVLSTYYGVTKYDEVDDASARALDNARAMALTQ